MGLGNAVGLTHLALRLVPKILDIIDVVPIVREELAVIDPEVVKVRYVQHVVAGLAVRIDDAIGNDLRSMIGIKGDLCVGLPAVLQQTEYRDFPRRATAALSLSVTAEVALSHLSLADEHSLAFGFQLKGDDLA